MESSHSPPIGKYDGDMLDDITELRTFVRIAAAGSLSAASREMGLALSVVSKRLASLERRAEVRLIARSTRSLALTEEGQRLFEQAQRILAEVDEAEAALRRGRAEPEGVLRVSAPHALGRAHVSPVCRDLVRTYPKISADLILTDRFVELIDERMDVVVRIGVLGTPTWSCASWPTTIALLSPRQTISKAAAHLPFPKIC